jgi:hypothetical protein
MCKPAFVFDGRLLVDADKLTKIGFKVGGNHQSFEATANHSLRLQASVEVLKFRLDASLIQIEISICYDAISWFGALFAAYVLEEDCYVF